MIKTKWSKNSLNGADKAHRGPREEHHHRLQTALVEAQQLAYFATRNGIPIDASVLENITTSAENCEELHSNPSKEKEFWLSFQALAAAVSPVTAESLRAADQGKEVIRRYAVWTSVILFILIGLQVYWIIGTNLVGEIGDLRVSMAAHRTNIVAGHAREDELGELIEIESKEVTRLEQQRLLSAFEPNHNSEADVDIRSRRRELRQKRAALYENRKKTEIASVSIREIRKEIDSKLFLLDGWIFIPRSLLKPGKNGDDYNSVHDISHEGEYFEVIEFTSQILVAGAEAIIRSMSSYLFPLLYGLLGSLALILRSLGRDIRDVTYSEETRVRCRLRWPLGMLAGIAVGWFSGASSVVAPGLQDLQPLAFAFLAGYSVDLVFTGLDRFVAAFSDKTVTAAR